MLIMILSVYGHAAVIRYSKNNRFNQSIKFIISVAHCRLDFTINSRIQILKIQAQC